MVTISPKNDSHPHDTEEFAYNHFKKFIITVIKPEIKTIKRYS